MKRFMKKIKEHSSNDICTIDNSRNTEASVWRTGYYFALLLLVLFGISLIIIGAAIFPQGSLPNVVIVGAGISMGPAAIVAALFRAFLFREVKYQLTQPVIDEVKERLGPEIKNQVSDLIEEYRKGGPEIKNQISDLIEEYREEIATLRALKDAGVIRPHKRRKMALRDFASAIEAEKSEIMVVGSSLKGLLQMDEYKEIADKLKLKINNRVRVMFLLTHPVVADLRAGQEARRPTEIGKEIIESLQILKDWGVPPENVRLYKGTPTCFAIKTGRKMLLNPYPYRAVSFDSPCLIVETSDVHPSYFYDEFDKSHFGAWGTDVAERIFDYNTTIGELNKNLQEYAGAVTKLLKL